MASHKKNTTDKYSFKSPTFLINCMTPCKSCDIIKKCVTKETKSYAKELGYNLVYNGDSTKCAEYHKKYGRPLGISSATPQAYAIDGDKIVGLMVSEGKVINGFKIPSNKCWDEQFLCDLIYAMTSLIG